MDALNCVIFLVLLCVIFKTAYCLDCYSCQNIDDPHLCNSTLSCQTSQVCYLDVTGGIYSMGCANNQHCGGISGVGIVGRDIAQRQTSNCLECCSSDGCNSDLCIHLKPTTCTDDETMDCARLNTIFHVCKDIQQAKLVCPKFCGLCTLVDGQWSQWSTWSNCDVTCGAGSQTRTRTCTNPSPANGGLDCVGSASETKHCKKDLCPVHGGWSKWSHWGTCSVTCGVGLQRRDRSCSNPYPSRNGDHCFGESRDDIICMPGACADGGWSSWGSWGSCSDSCGTGVRSRLRTCSNPRPSLLGRSCDGSPEQMIPCNKQTCEVPLDGGWSRWGSWGTCSDSCGGGVRSRLRTCSNPRPSLLGRYCDGSPIQTMTCNKQTCEVPTHGGWSSWGSWGTCSENCGGGIRSKLRTCSNPRPSLLGRYCDGSPEHTNLCNRHVCAEFNVAFTAYNLNTSVSSYSILQFTSTDLNNGNAYSTTTGKFTCPVAGVYHFSVTLTKNNKLITALAAYLRINGSNKLELYWDPYDDSKNQYEATPLTMSGTFHLNKNDVVDVYRRPDYFYSYYTSQFTGYLITPD